MTKDVGFAESAKEMFGQLPKGAFLTVKQGDRINTMTIGWAATGIIWGKPILMVTVRYSRHTYGLLDGAKEFTVSVPVNVDLKKELAFCGSKSGRDFDKFAELDLTAQPGKVIATPVIGQCDLHYECKVVYQQAMEPALLDQEIKKKFYPKPDYHVIYYGEIVACYMNE